MRLQKSPPWWNSFHIVFKTLQESLHSLNRYFTSICTGNVCCSSVFITTSMVKLKRNRTELLKEKNFFYFSVKDLVNSGKNSTTRIRDLLRTVNLRAIFPVKKVLCNTRTFCCTSDTSVKTYENGKCSNLSEFQEWTIFKSDLMQLT